MAKPNLKDELLKVTVALPNGAATTTTPALQLQSTSTGSDFVAPAELLVTLPNLNATELPDTQTITVTVETSDTTDFASSRVISGSTVVTGAGGVGASTQQLRVHPPSDVGAYVRAKAVKTGAGNASTSSLTLQVVV